jgi:hypothetical protein
MALIIMSLKEKTEKQLTTDLNKLSSIDETIIMSIIKEARYISEFDKIADLKMNIKQTWINSQKNIDMFSKKMKLWLNNYLTRNKSPIDRKNLREAIFEATDSEAILGYKNNEWVIVKAPSKITV